MPNARAELASLEQQLAAAPALRLELEQAREAELKARRLAEERLERGKRAGKYRVPAAA